MKIKIQAKDVGALARMGQVWINGCRYLGFIYDDRYLGPHLTGSDDSPDIPCTEDEWVEVELSPYVADYHD